MNWIFQSLEDPYFMSRLGLYNATEPAIMIFISFRAYNEQFYSKKPVGIMIKFMFLMS